MHHRLLKVPYLVAVFDKEAAEYCSAMGISWVWANKELGSANFRKDFKRFRWALVLGALK